MIITASRAVELLRDEARDADEPLRVYWHEMTEASRQEFASELLNLRGGLPIVPIVLRGALFENPNALLSDLATLIDHNRNAFIGVPGTRSGCLCVMLLARTRLQTPQVSSPRHASRVVSGAGRARDPCATASIRRLGGSGSTECQGGESGAFSRAAVWF